MRMAPYSKTDMVLKTSSVFFGARVVIPKTAGWRYAHPGAGIHDPAWKNGDYDAAGVGVSGIERNFLAAYGVPTAPISDPASNTRKLPAGSGRCRGAFGG